MNRLDVRANYLQDLGAVAQLKELSYLNISQNVALGELVFPVHNNINTVVAEECELKSLDVFFPISSLYTLDVSGNKIDSIEAIKDMTKLKELDISDNLIQKEDVLRQFPYLSIQSWDW